MAIIEIQINTPSSKFSLDVSKINLFIGPNGSGKSKTLESLKSNVQFRDVHGKNGQMVVDENRINRQKQQGVPHRGNLDQNVTQTDFSNYDFENNPKIKNVNVILKQVFGREIKNTGIEGMGLRPCYIKENSVVPIINDSLGITSVSSIIETLEIMQDDSSLLIEEITMGLHPSVVKPILDKICEIAIKKNIAIVCTTQDFVCALYFMNRINDEKYRVFAFSETGNIIIAEKITENNQRDKMRDFVGEFPTMHDFNTMSDFIS